MKLNHIKKSVIEVDYNDFDRFVNEIYFKPNEYEFVADHEANNYSSYIFRVNGKISEDPWTQEEIKSIRSGKPTRNTGLLLNLLCADGHIEAGEYLINVFW